MEECDKCNEMDQTNHLKAHKENELEEWVCLFYGEIFCEIIISLKVYSQRTFEERYHGKEYYLERHCVYTVSWVPLSPGHCFNTLLPANDLGAEKVWVTLSFHCFRQW